MKAKGGRKPPPRSTLASTVPKRTPMKKRPARIDETERPRRPSPPRRGEHGRRSSIPETAGVAAQLARSSIVAPASASASARSDAEGDEKEKSILDLVDNLLNQGVVINGELILGVAGVDLIYLRLSALLAAADRVLPRPVK